MTNIYKQLNQAQNEAVNNIDGPMLVLAGPGTGKTQLLSARVMKILEVSDTPPSSILCLTFTESGANNMRNRLSRFIGSAAYEVEIHTYHGFAQSIINQFSDYFTDKNLQKTIDFVTQYQFLKEYQDEMVKNNILKKASVRDLLATFSELKRSLISSADLRQIAATNKQAVADINQEIALILKDIKKFPSSYVKAEPLFTKIGQVLEKYTPNTKPLPKINSIFRHALKELQKAAEQAQSTNKSTPFTNWKSKFLIKQDDNTFGFNDKNNYYRLIHLADIFEYYNQKVKQAGFYDFDDMILEVIDSIDNNLELKLNLQEKFLYILLDEYQDTNRAQSKLITLIADNEVNEGRPNIMAVGDDDQAIYAFQGAEFSNMLDFYQRYRETKLINLTENYRSHQAILDFASNISNQIEQRVQGLINNDTHNKELTASNKSIKKADIQRLDFSTLAAENQWLAEKIKDLIDQGEQPHEIAVLGVRHASLMMITPYLARLDIPISYEKRQNVLDNIGIQALIKIAQTVQTIANQKYHNNLLFEVLSYDFWGIETADLWQINWQTRGGGSLLQTMLGSNNQKIIEIALWFLEFAKKTTAMSLEANIDFILGNSAFTVKHQQTELKLRSPLKSYYLQSQPENLLDFVLDINTLYNVLIDFRNNHSDLETPPLLLLQKIIESYINSGEVIGRKNIYKNSDSSVQLMTPFSAKGLEFKHVFLVETNQARWGGSQPGRNKISLPDNLRFIRHEKSSEDEQLRLLFVAITRAKTNLYLLNYLLNDNEKPTKRLKFLNEVEFEGAFISNAIPEPFNVIKKITIEPTVEMTENHLFDNFIDWRNRHLTSTIPLRNLLQDKINNFRLSPTNLNNFTDLKYNGPSSFLLNNILKIPGEFSLTLIYGNLFHATVEYLQKNNLDELTDPQLLEIFQQKLNDYSLIQTDRQQLTNWAAHELPIFYQQRKHIFSKQPKMTIKTEVNFYSQNIVEEQAILTGIIDRLEIDETNHKITIVDYKTGKAHFKHDPSDNTLYNHITQLYFYNILLKNSKLYPGYNITNWRLEYVSPDVENKIHYLEGEFETSTLDHVKKLISAVWQRIQNFDFEDPEELNKKNPTLSDRKKFEQRLIDDCFNTN